MVSTSTAEQFVNTFTGQVTELAGDMATRASHGVFTEFLTRLNWATPSWDIIILIVFVLTVFFYSFALGRDRILGILISTYIALAVSYSIPFMAKIQSTIAASGFFAFQISALLLSFCLFSFYCFKVF